MDDTKKEATESEAASTAPADPGRRARRATIGAMLAVHVGLVLYFVPPSKVFSRRPLWDIDYALHWYQVHRALEAYRGYGKLWGYDPQVLAGHASGALEDVSFKAVELWVIGLRSVNVHPAVGYNLFILLVHLSVPFIAFGVGVLFRLSRRQRVALIAMWSLLWFFDAFVHWVWFCGMISWALASMLGIVALGFLYRCLEKDARRVHFLGLALTTSFLAMHHPFIALSIAAPALGVYLRDARGLGWRLHAALACCLGLSVVATALWLPTALDFKHYMLREDTFLRPTLDYLIYDFLDITRSPDQSGPLTRTLWRVLALGAGVVTLLRWRREGDRRMLLFALLGGSTLVLSYTGSLLYVTRVTQPYRHIVPMALGMAVPAAILLADLLRPSELRSLGRATRLLLLLVGLVLLPRIVRTVLVFFPDIEVRKKDLKKMRTRASRLRLGGYFDSPNYAMRQHLAPKTSYQVRDWLRPRIAKKPGRVVVEDYMLGEFLASHSKLAILGGLHQRSFHHGDAHLFRLDPGGALPGQGLKRYLERYAVRYVVMTKFHRKLEYRRDLLKFRKAIGGSKIRIYETLIEPSYFKVGKGRVLSQKLNRVEVAAPLVDGKPQPQVVLRFHWMETLRCKPGCRIERVPDEEDRVGFIRVRNAPARFTIYNSYKFK